MFQSRILHSFGFWGENRSNKLNLKMAAVKAVGQI